MRMKFELGDKVKILDGRTIEPKRLGQLWIKTMDHMVGRVFTISETDYKANAFRVGAEPYWFDESWLEPVKAIPDAIDIFMDIRDLFGRKEKDEERSKDLRPRRIYKGGRRLVVLWRDGTKTVVERAEGEPDSAYAAFTAALAIKIYGSNSRVRKIVETTEEPQKKKKKAKKETQKEQKEKKAQKGQKDKK